MKYLGVVEPHTRGPDGVLTGLAHLKELGITHLHLLPVFDFISVDGRDRTQATTGDTIPAL